jgi:voltage-gated potassium channel
MQRLRRRTWSLLNGSEGLGRAIDAFMVTLIAANVIVIVAESEPAIASRDAETFFRIFDVVSSLIFTLEYLLRLWTAVEDPDYAHPIAGRLRFARTPMALVDLVAILPFWLPMVTTLDLRFVRALRLFRLFRLLKIARYSRAISALIRVFSRKKDQLSMTFFAVSLALILFASLMYFVEHPAQPDKFTSIPQTMWWAAATLTTVGYGDLYPVTTAGQIIGGLISFTGVVIIAVPAGIVASGFTEEVEALRRAEALERATAARAKRRRAPLAEPEGPSAAPPAALSGGPTSTDEDLAHLPCPHCGKPVAIRLEPFA